MGYNHFSCKLEKSNQPWSQLSLARVIFAEEGYFHHSDCLNRLNCFFYVLSSGKHEFRPGDVLIGNWSLWSKTKELVLLCWRWLWWLLTHFFANDYLIYLRHWFLLTFSPPQARPLKSLLLLVGNCSRLEFRVSCGLLYCSPNDWKTLNSN